MLRTAAMTMALPVVAALIVITCAGCTGGAGGPPPALPVPPFLPLPEFPPLWAPPCPSENCIDTADFGCLGPQEYPQRQQGIAGEHAVRAACRNQWGLDATGAHRAYANLELARGSGTVPGSGVTVGFVDSGIDLDHPVFTSDVKEFPSNAEDETGAVSSHGTSVASVVAADARALIQVHPDGAFQGVAWGADLKMFAIPVEGGGGPYIPASPEILTSVDADLSSIMSHAPSRPVDILNLSFGIPGNISD